MKVIRLVLLLSLVALQAGGAASAHDHSAGAGVYLAPPHWELVDGGVPVRLEALRRHDARELGGNDDGVITAADRIWPRLRLWQDRDADGVSSRDELLLPASCGISRFELGPRRAGRGADVEVLTGASAAPAPLVTPPRPCGKSGGPGS